MKAVIIEDENLIARELQHKIAKIAPDISIEEHCDSLEMARAWMKANRQPDIFFMDIQLGDGISFELFKEFEIKAPVIFTTAYDEYALQAFKSNGVDYLLKPVDTEELQKAIDKCRKINEHKAVYPQDFEALIKAWSTPQASPKYKEKFIVNFRKQWIPINTKDIAVFHRENINYLTTFTGEKYILDFTTLEKIEDLLDPNLYYRVSREAIVHIDAIRSIKPLDNQTLQVYLKPPLDKMEVSVGRAKAPQFKKWFDR
ncbi:MAG: LytTR family DNA-binding domain-containing protein [Bacteroidota bacterium]